MQKYDREISFYLSQKDTKNYNLIYQMTIWSFISVKRSFSNVVIW